MPSAIKVLVGILALYIIFVKFPHEVGTILLNIGQSLAQMTDH